MERTTISLPPDLHRKLRVIAAERGISMAHLIREALEEKTVARRRRLLSAGVGASEGGGIARESAEMKFEPPAWRS
jgi:predicted transcriptional regulator